MKKSDRKNSNLVQAFAQRTIFEVYLPRIERCLGNLKQSEIWWRPNDSCNSIGNLVLHLQGNVRQWIVSTLGGSKDIRQRPLEFSEKGPIARTKLLQGLRRTLREAQSVIHRLSPSDLRRRHIIQGFPVTGGEAVLHVTEHFSHHAGQIIYVTKLLKERDLGFTHLPGEKVKKNKRRLRAV